MGIGLQLLADMLEIGKAPADPNFDGKYPRNLKDPRPRFDDSRREGNVPPSQYRLPARLEPQGVQPNPPMNDMLPPTHMDNRGGSPTNSGGYGGYNPMDNGYGGSNPMNNGGYGAPNPMDNGGYGGYNPMSNDGYGGYNPMDNGGYGGYNPMDNGGYGAPYGEEQVYGGQTPYGADQGYGGEMGYGEEDDDSDGSGDRPVKKKKW